MFDKLKKEIKVMSSLDPNFSLLLLLPEEVLQKVMYFTLCKGNPVCRLVCKKMRSAVDTMIHSLWIRLEKKTPEGGIPLKKLMLEVKSLNNGINCSIFWKLNQKIKLEYSIKYQPVAVPMLKAHFSDIQKTMSKLDNNLMKTWQVLKRKIFFTIPDLNLLMRLGHSLMIQQMNRS